MSTSTPVPGGRLSGEERAVLGHISLAEMRRHLTWFAGRGLRLGGSEAERAAAAYIHEQLHGMGIDCVLEEFDALVSYAEEPESFGPARVSVEGGTTESYSGKVYAFSAATGRAGRAGDLVYVGPGSPAAYEQLHAEVRGRIALSELSFDAPHAEPARVAEERGAIGLIVMNWSDRDGPRIHTGTAKSVWGNPTPPDLDRLPHIPVVALSRRDGLRLLELTRAGPTRVSIVAEASRRWVRAVQPIATIPGASDEFVLVHGHLDTFGAGMTDNATGVVGLLELARVLHQHRQEMRRSVRFAWWACHEMPYAGSTWHLDARWDEYRDRCVAALNADAWALEGSCDHLVALGFAEIRDLEQGVLRDVLGLTNPVRDFGTKDADQSFWGLGIPSGLIIAPTPDFPTGPFLGSWFHSEFDTAEHVDVAALEQLVRVYAVLIHRLCAQPVMPYSYAATARQVVSLLQVLIHRAPPSVQLASVFAAAEALAATLAQAERVIVAGGEDRQVRQALNRVGRVLNPVLYTVVGRYGQDPIAATYLAQRLPGLQRALDHLHAAEDDEMQRQCWLTAALRERNRLSDALAEARAILDSLLR